MAFDRDLGYLDKFFDNLDAHASTLGDVQGARLKTLVGEERQRWGEIRSLLGGPSSAGEKSEKSEKGDKKPSDGEEKPAPAAPAARADTSAPKLSETAAPAAALTAGASSGAKGDVTASATRVPVSGFTVGSLRGGR